MLELYYRLFTNFCDTEKYEEVETNTNLLRLAPAEKKYKIVYEKRKSKSGNCYVARTVMIR